MALTDEQIGKTTVNGHVYFFDHVRNVKQVSKSRWTAERYGVEYQIEGGRHAGGTSREWFVDCQLWNGSIDCTSLVDALKLIDTL